MRLLRFGFINYKAFCQTGSDLIDPGADELPLHWIDTSSDVILIAGENNCGKTSILSAYRDFRSSGFIPSIADFHQKCADSPLVMEVLIAAENAEELTDDAVRKWFSEDRKEARVRRVWTTPDTKGIKYSFDPQQRKWVEGGFGGFDTILQNRLPEPIHIKPVMSSDEVRGEFHKLFKEVVSRYLQGSDEHEAIRKAFEAITKKIEEDGYIQDIAERVTRVASEVFPGLAVTVRNPPSEKGIAPLFEKQADIEVSVNNSPPLGVDRHGQGSQRVFILGALSVLADELANLAKKISQNQA